MMNYRRMTAVFACAGAMLLGWGVAQGDEVWFVNGDRLTGTIKQIEGGKLTIGTAMAGDVTAELSKIKRFSTTQPVSVRMRDGRVIRRTGISGWDGGIAVEGDDVTLASLPPPGSSDAGPPTASAGLPPATHPATVPATARVAMPTTVPAAQVVRVVAGPPARWTGAVTVAGLMTRGNTETESLNASVNVVRRAEWDRITLDGGFLYSAERSPETGEETTTADSWFAFGKYDYFFTHRLYAYGSTRVERDRVAELDLRLTPAAGLGYQWAEGLKFNLFTEAGVAWVYEEYENVEDSTNHMAARLAYRLDAMVNDKVKLFHGVEYLPSLEDVTDFNLSADAGVRASLTPKMFTEFKVELRYDETPAPGAEHTDLRYVLGVGWQF